MNTDQIVDLRLPDNDFKLLLDLLPVGVGISNDQGELVYFNQAMLMPGGWEKSDIAEIKNVTNLYFDTRERQRILELTSKEGAITNNIVKFKKKAGGFYNAQMSLIKIQFRGANAWLALVRDMNQVTQVEAGQSLLITQLEDTKKAMLNLLEDLDEQKLSSDRQRQRYLATLEYLGEGVIATDKDGTIILVNQAAETLLGYTEAELLNKKCVEVILAEDENGTRILPENRALTQALQKSEPLRRQYNYIKKDGSKFAADTVDSPILQDKKLIGGVMVFRDVTKENAIDRAKSEFVSLASHQLRTPLGIAKWYLEAITTEPDYANLSATLKEYINEVYTSNERVLALVRDLLSVSRIDQGKVKDSPELTDVIDLISGVVKDMQIVATKKKIKVASILPPAKILSIQIDKLRLHEVIENLITNAILYNSPAGSVTVSLSEGLNHELEIEVTDTGIGIPAADLEKLFGKFFRSEKAASFNTEGSGLGLYVVKSYVEAWGGKISVISQENKGSTFKITIPIKNKFETAKE